MVLDVGTGGGKLTDDGPGCGERGACGTGDTDCDRSDESTDGDGDRTDDCFGDWCGDDGGGTCMIRMGFSGASSRSGSVPGTPEGSR